MASIYESANGWVSTIVQSALSTISADQTILCKIEDNTSSAIGQYSVSYNSIRFEAYTDNNVYYNIDDSVYVLIPQGNYDEQKIILCKKR